MVQRIYLKPAKTKNHKKLRQFFMKGLDLASAILVSFKDAGDGFLRSLPNSYPTFRLLKELFGVQGYGYTKINSSTLRSSIWRLKQQGLVAKDPKQKIYYLTEKGKRMAAEIHSRYIRQSPTRPWDGKLRIVVFDVPESKRGWRDALRRELITSQFYQLQESVYIGKYPLPEDFYQELENNNILLYIFLLTVGDIDRRETVLQLLEKRSSLSSRR